MMKLKEGKTNLTNLMRPTRGSLATDLCTNKIQTQTEMRNQNDYIYT